MKGLNVGGHNTNNLRYADNTSLLDVGEQKLQNLLTTVNDKGKLYGMEINMKKTKSMVASKKKLVYIWMEQQLSKCKIWST